MNQHLVKAAEMKEWGKLLYKLAVLNDLFELEELAAALRERTEWDYKTATLGHYLRGRRNPPADFFDQVRRALDLDERMYSLLLYTYHRSEGKLTPHQREQIRAFEQMLMDEAKGSYVDSNAGAAH